MATIVDINKGQRSKTISKREQSIDKKFVGRNDNAVQIAFTFYVIAIAAKLARVDANSPAGIESEVDSFKEIFSIPASELDKVDEFYKEAVKDGVHATHYAKQLVNLFPNNRLLLEELVDDLLVFADADSSMTSGKVKFMKEVVLALNFNERFFGRVLRKHIIVSNPNPFILLDISKDVSYVDLKKRYRHHVKDWHPDKFSGAGVAPELAEIAREQFDIYSKAYEAVKIERGFIREVKK